MSLPTVTGVAPRWESGLAELLGGSDRAQLVRRCADVPELLGVAGAGLARVAVVSSDFRSLDRSAVEMLLAAGVAVVGVHPPGQPDAGRTLRRWGVRVVLPVDIDAEALDEAIATAVDDPPREPNGPSRHGGVQHAARDDDRVDGDHSGNEHHRGSARDVRPERGPENDEDTEVAPSATTPSRRGDDLAGPTPDDRDLDATAAGPVDDLVLPSGYPGPDGIPDPVDEELRRLVEEAGGGPPLGGPDVDGPADDDEDDEEETREPGEVLVVWGPGSPGRTTVALNLAAELATPLSRVVLIDADTVGASLAQCLAVLDEAPGLAAAARVADQGGLDGRALARLAPEVRPGLLLLTGLPRADRWPELRESALADVIEVARRHASYVVVDVAAAVDHDEELSFDTQAPRRNGATLTALGAADRVVVVGAGDPIGLQRLVRGLDALPALTAATRDVLVTRVRPGPVGPEPERRIREALERFAGARAVHLVPEDRESLDAALLHGRALVEVRPTSPARASIRALADRIAGREQTPGRPGARWWPRRQRA